MKLYCMIQTYGDANSSNQHFIIESRQFIHIYTFLLVHTFRFEVLTGDSLFFFALLCST